MCIFFWSQKSKLCHENKEYFRSTGTWPLWGLLRWGPVQGTTSFPSLRTSCCLWWEKFQVLSSGARLRSWGVTFTGERWKGRRAYMEPPRRDLMSHDGVFLFPIYLALTCSFILLNKYLLKTYYICTVLWEQLRGIKESYLFSEYSTYVLGLGGKGI